MKILIVDDNNNKVMKIRSEITKCEELKSVQFVKATSIVDALSKLVIEKFDFALIDMCIPEDFGCDLLEDGGLRLVNIILKDKRYIKPSDITLLTAYTDYLEKFKFELTGLPFSIEVFNDTSIEWAHKIIKKLEYQFVKKNSLSEKRGHNYDIAILTAVEIERKAVMNLSNSWNAVKVESDSTNYFETVWESKGRKIRVIATSLTQMGLVSATAVTCKLIFNFAPRYVLMPGIAGGVKEEYEFGDIIIPREVKDYCSGKYTSSDDSSSDSDNNPFKYFIPSSLSISTDMDIINCFTKSYDDVLQKIHAKWHQNSKYKTPTIRNGFIASGDSVIQNKVVIDLMIKSHLRFADALDMEAYGLYYAAHQSISPKPTPLCMKAISDFANKDKSDEHQAYAAYTSAEFMKYFVMNELCFD